MGNQFLEHSAGAGFIAASGVLGVKMVFWLTIGLVGYVLQAAACSRIARRRGIHHSWLAWVPVGRQWLLGCISDQYQSLVKGRTKNKRRILLVLDLVVNVGAVALIAMVASLMTTGILEMNHITDALWMSAIQDMIGILLLALVLSGVSVALVVVQYFALYDVYTSCDSYNNVIYLVLSILIGWLTPLLLFLCRNKDQGMPPQDGYRTREPWENL